MELKAINAYQLTTNTEDSDVYIHNDEFGCGGDLVECYLKADTDQVIADLERKVAMLHRQCIIHKLRAEELRLNFWRSQREWWESKDRGNTKPLFDYAEKEQSCVKLMCKLKKKLDAYT